eukprot:TRINITY_DN13623_c0_g1_i1.p1 TRINITY_DN13623_c0_g1~~TRINITY_DN13623_c0_g1_i1.p1  ORF type:complete len:259 (-),score=35.71 TRINITY_DN13623_c0_g1_i1:177-953(-)
MTGDVPKFALDDELSWQSAVTNSCRTLHLTLEQRALEEHEERSGCAGRVKERVEGVGHWTDEEHLRFLEALRLHGKNWKLIQQHIRTRSATQIRSHAQKHFNKLKQANKEDAAEKGEVPNSRAKRKKLTPEEKPKKIKGTKLKRKLHHVSNQNAEHENIYYSDQIDNVNLERFPEEISNNSQEQQDRFYSDFDFASIPQLSPLIHADHESSACAQLPWNSEIELESFGMSTKDFWLHEESGECLPAYVRQCFAPLFEP